MAINPNDDLAKLFSNYNVNRRFVFFLWILLKYENINAIEFDFEIHSIRNKLFEYINKNQIDYNIHMFPKQFLPDNEFNWIEENGYQPDWLLLEFIKNTGISIQFINHPNPKDILIGLFDIWNKSIQDKKITIENLKNSWAQRQSFIKNFYWYKSSGKEKQKCQIAWQWYQQNHEILLGPNKLFSKLDDILYFLDKTIFSPTEKLYHLEQIKKKFKALQTKENRQGKKQTNISLSEESRQKLEELAKQGRITKTEVIEILIKMAYKNGMQI
ncbi:hypothetical protein ACM5Q9_13955 [Advenella sp. RU8]|uniref:hypothetical protein n=1 Tax=Advenella sp. RU8 TaxID=3399575 RepID=UPI003AADCAF6